MEGHPLVSGGRGRESPGRLAGGARGIFQGIRARRGRGRDLHPSRAGPRESRWLERGPAGAGGGSSGGSGETVRHPARVRAGGGQSAFPATFPIALIRSLKSYGFITAGWPHSSRKRRVSSRARSPVTKTKRS